MAIRFLRAVWRVRLKVHAPASEQGITLLEVVIAVVIIGFILVTASQFLHLVTTGSKASVADPGGYIAGQEVVDRINLFFNTIAKDFRMAKEVMNEEGELTLSFPDGSEVIYAVEDGEDGKEVWRNNAKVIWGVTSVEIHCNENELSVSLSVPGNGTDRQYTLFVTGRNTRKR